MDEILTPLPIDLISCVTRLTTHVTRLSPQLTPVTIQANLPISLEVGHISPRSAPRYTFSGPSLVKLNCLIFSAEVSRLHRYSWGIFLRGDTQIAPGEKKAQPSMVELLSSHCWKKVTQATSPFFCSDVNKPVDTEPIGAHPKRITPGSFFKGLADLSTR
jgi:hypothetical protein